MIQANYYLNRDKEPLSPNAVYHSAAYEAALSGQQPLPEYFVAALSPAGYRTMFDELANSLVLLAGLGSPEQVESIVSYTSNLRRRQVVRLLPAFHPVIDEGDPLWNDLRLHYAWEFRNRPGEYHNGGIWPVTNGVYIAALAAVGRGEEAVDTLAALDAANGLSVTETELRFPEYLHGRTGEPKGTTPIALSAAASVIGHQVVEKHEKLLSCHEDGRSS